MEWSDLRVFLAAVRAGSYSRASEVLGINRTTVSRRVVALEAALGVDLFHFTPLGPEPTREGSILLDCATEVEARIEAMRREVGSPELPNETIRVASSAGIACEFLEELELCQRSRPRAAIELIGDLDPLEAVTQRRADLAIALIGRPPRHLSGTQIGTLSQARYALRGRTNGLRLGWGHEIEAAIPGQWTSANPAGADAEATGVLRVNDWPQLKQAVLAGIGEATLWCFAAERELTLERLAPPDASHDSPLWLLHRAKAPRSPLLVGLIETLAAVLRDRLERRAESAT